MAIYNITEIKSQTDNLHPSAAQLTAGETRNLLKDTFSDSLVSRKDRKVTLDSTGKGIDTLDFSNAEMIIATVNQSIDYSIVGMQDGDVRFLSVSKAAGNIVAFVAGEVFVNRSYLNSLSFVQYILINKNGLIFVDSITKTFDKQVNPFSGLNANDYITEKFINDNKAAIANIWNPKNISWINIPLLNGWTGSVSYKNDFFGYSHLIGHNLNGGSATSTVICDLLGKINVPKLIAGTLKLNDRFTLSLNLNLSYYLTGTTGASSTEGFYSMSGGGV